MTNAVFGAKQLPPFTGEARVTIRDDAPREAMKAKNVREHQVRGVFSTLNLAGTDEKTIRVARSVTVRTALKALPFCVTSGIPRTQLMQIYCHFRVGGVEVGVNLVLRDDRV